jgi:hypothetical protein
MDEFTRNLKGSKAKDAFLRWHKFKCPRSFYGSDADLVLIRREPFDIIAVLDFKQDNGYDDKVLFSEVCLYNKFVDWGVPVFIVWASWDGNEEFTGFKVFQYLYGDPLPHPPKYHLEPIFENANGREYVKWEESVRKGYEPRITIQKFNTLYIRATKDSLDVLKKRIDDIGSDIKEILLVSRNTENYIRMFLKSQIGNKKRISRNNAQPELFDDHNNNSNW